MNAAQWMEKARTQTDKLAAFVEAWHPVKNPSGMSKKTQRITAPQAEAANEVVRRMIAKEEDGLTTPGRAFRVALAGSDYARAYTLLNAAWFGVPETASCWDIDGFSEAVALLEDPADEEQPDGAES